MAGTNGRKNGLTPKQAAFVREYAIDLNATQAAVRAGYSKRTAGAIGRENLQKPAVAAAIEEHQRSKVEIAEITPEFVLKGLAREATDTKRGTPSSRTAALSWLGKFHSLFTEKRLIEGHLGLETLLGTTVDDDGEDEQEDPDS